MVKLELLQIFRNDQCVVQYGPESIGFQPKIIHTIHLCQSRMGIDKYIHRRIPPFGPLLYHQILHCCQFQPAKSRCAGTGRESNSILRIPLRKQNTIRGVDLLVHSFFRSRSTLQTAPWHWPCSPLPSDSFRCVAQDCIPAEMTRCLLASGLGSMVMHFGYPQYFAILDPLSWETAIDLNPRRFTIRAGVMHIKANVGFS